MHAGHQGVRTRLRGGMSGFSRCERRIARLLLDDPASATDTVSVLARRAGVSAPTVVRFARRCGFAGYGALRDALRAEVAAGAEARPGGAAARVPPGSRAGPAQAATLLAEGTRETLAALAEADLAEAVRLLGLPRNRVFLDGGRFTGIAARCLALRLMRLREDVFMMPDHPVSRTSFARDLRRTDVMVLFDHRPYEERTARIAGQAKASGARVVLFTDPWFSPVTEVADVVLTAAVRSPVPHTGLVPTLALVETLVAVLADSGDIHPSG
ncbi:MAG TPA: MurR/RpiR family transcriptional regulator [Streptomyces sp.]|nr:MurR/RpiR family transcriptional regulator [Streptomyces sp.]